MLDRARQNELIEALYAAALDPSRWPAVLTSLNVAYASRVALLCGQRGYDGDVTFSQSAGIESQELQAWKQYYAARDLRTQRAMVHPVGRVTTEMDLLSKREWRRSEIYDWSVRTNKPYVMGTLLANGHQTIVFSLSRSKSAGVFDCAEKANLEQLIPHLARSVRLAQRISSYAAHSRATFDALDRFPFGVASVDRNGKVLEATGCLQRLLREADGLYLDDGCIAAKSADETKWLRMNVSLASEERLSSPRGSSISLKRAGRPALVVYILPRSVRTDLTGASSRATALLFAFEQEESRQPLVLFAREHGLTPPEQRLIESLLAGYGVNESARVLELSIHTARNILKRARLKTGARTQRDLVRLALLFTSASQSAASTQA